MQASEHRPVPSFAFLALSMFHPASLSSWLRSAPKDLSEWKALVRAMQPVCRQIELVLVDRIRRPAGGTKICTAATDIFAVFFDGSQMSSVLAERMFANTTPN